MYRRFMSKTVKTKKGLEQVLKVFKENRIAPFFRCNGVPVWNEKDTWHRGYWREDEVVDIKTLLKEGLTIVACVGSCRNGSTKKHDVCVELGFVFVEGEV